MLSWKFDLEKCTELIIKNKSKFKILLKTKDEDEMLLSWLDWHLDILDEREIFIFDNLSTNAGTLDIYRSHPNLNVFSYDGFHNDLHRPARVFGLYEALSESTENFIFLDTDERLACVRSDQTGLICRSKIREVVVETAIITQPTIWIENSTGREDVFVLNKNLEHFKSGLKLGKPIVSCGESYSQMMNHNFQLNSDIINRLQKYRFVTFHLKNLNANQRIKSNMNKLFAYNAFKRKMGEGKPTILDVLGIDVTDLPPGNKKNWIKEIQYIHNNPHSAMGDGEFLSKWQFKIDSGANFIFGSPELEDYFKNSFSGCILS